VAIVCDYAVLHEYTAWLFLYGRLKVVSETPFYIVRMAIGFFTVWLFVIFISLSIKGVEWNLMDWMGKIANGIEVLATRHIGVITVVTIETIITIAEELRAIFRASEINGVLGVGLDEGKAQHRCTTWRRHDQTQPQNSILGKSW